jgi:simple sugar transport system permease protein
MEFVISALITIIGASTPLIYAALGELVAERAGVLNLGVEGMILVGAIAGFAATILTGSPWIGVAAAALAGAAMASVFAILTLGLLANQVATGLALTLFGVGLSALIGSSYVGTPLAALPSLHIPVLSSIPVVGEILFQRDGLVYGAFAAVLLVAWFLSSTRMGMILRAVGESHDAAHALGHRVLRIRALAVIFGGAMAGVGGAYLSMAYTPMWAENMSAGRGWIALALVVFGTWKPFRVAAGALLFGAVTILQLHAQGLGVNVPSQLLSMLPYIATIIVLTVISRDVVRLRLSAPACLGKPFHPSVAR